MDTRNGGRSREGRFSWGQERSQGSIRQGGQERPPEQAPKLRATIVKEVPKALQDVFPTLQCSGGVKSKTKER